jgi:hypothetical protein
MITSAKYFLSSVFVITLAYFWGIGTTAQEQTGKDAPPDGLKLYHLCPLSF